MCCCNPSLATLEQIYRKPLWVFALEQENMLTQGVYEICVAVFSQTNFDQQAFALFDQIETSRDGFVDDSELERFLRTMPSSVALTDTDRESMMGLYKKITGRKTKISKNDFPIFLRCIFALVIAHGVVNLKLGKTDINLAGFGSTPAGSPDVEKGPDPEANATPVTEKASIHEIPSDEEDNNPAAAKPEADASSADAAAAQPEATAAADEHVNLNVQ
eukprot:CAMPEP_0204822828 /NCGR_PEP_ID=MMETSP1346-20131115/1015_1 /ASSEMBLY_ACC=CAM_ASM_000771 /TAXON_ID=215587 /ORGANISM="Aplanochytrium stocchinoi, Strain GSBS06" /LENGTH=217 /DNA_ID=CAMNT_0051949257 /DNA_START=487 /DNA_END=1140 /DNA_ORIENTATION=-